MNKLEQAALMLAVAKDSILQITGAPRVEVNMKDGSFEVPVIDDEKFDQLAEGREVKVTKLKGSLIYPYKHSFWLHGIQFSILRKEGGNAKNSA
jgi:hypothetical protein